MDNSKEDLQSLENKARGGDRSALAALFSAHRDRLNRWLDLRLDPKLRGRLSSSDLLQEVYLAAEQRLEHFGQRPDLPFAVWVRLLAGQRLVDARRRHLGAAARMAGREVAGEWHVLSEGESSQHMAASIAADLTSPSQAAMRGESMDLLVKAIEEMDPIDREVLALRHFDELSNDEVAQLLGIPKGTASKRYVRALGRLRAILQRIPGLLEQEAP